MIEDVMLRREILPFVEKSRKCPPKNAPSHLLLPVPSLPNAMSWHRCPCQTSVHCRRHRPRWLNLKQKPGQRRRYLTLWTWTTTSKTDGVVDESGTDDWLRRVGRWVQSSTTSSTDDSRLIRTIHDWYGRLVRTTGTDHD